MSMHTQQEWGNATHLNMTQAQSAHHAATQQIQTSKKAHDETVVSNIAMYDQMQKAMGQKVRTTQRLIEKLTTRQHSVEQAFQATRSSHALVEKALVDKDAPLQLCLWRLEQRERRPLREQVRDYVETALEEEKDAIVETQRRLAEALRRTKAAIHDLRDTMEELKVDIEHKHHALSVDETCLRSTEKSMHAVMERTPPPASARGPGGTPRSPNGLKMARHQAAVHDSNSNEVRRQQEAERLGRSCANKEEAAKALREDNAKMASQCDRIVSEATTKSEKRMQDRIQENQSMRKRLENELRETHNHIQHTKQTILETRYQLKALDEPLDLTHTCASWRQQRATKEHIVDPVSTVISKHRSTVLAHQQDLIQHQQQENAHLKELAERRDRLKEDLKDKTLSLHIDLACLTHEAVRHTPTSPISARTTPSSPMSTRLSPNGGTRHQRMFTRSKSQGA